VPPLSPTGLSGLPTRETVLVISMIGNLLLVSDADMNDILAAPESVHELLNRRVYEAEHPDGYVDIDKAWHCLHFLLTGTAWEGEPPLDFIAVGGETLGDEDVGYGPARAIRATTVAALDSALEALPPNVLVTRYDPAQMAALEIYPGGWTEVENTPEHFGYFTGAYDEVRALVKRGAREGRALIIWLA
jgi:hypothetical protein